MHKEHATPNALFNGLATVAEARASETVVVIESVLPRYGFEIALPNVEGFDSRLGGSVVVSIDVPKLLVGNLRSTRRVKRKR